jgi:hypothetical protein
MFALNLLLIITTAYFAKFAYDIGEYSAMVINIMGFILNVFGAFVQVYGTSTNNNVR